MTTREAQTSDLVALVARMSADLADYQRADSTLDLSWLETQLVDAAMALRTAVLASTPSVEPTPQ